MEVGMSFFKVEEKLSQWCVLEACHTEVAYVRGWSLQRPLLEFGSLQIPPLGEQNNRRASPAPCKQTEVQVTGPCK